MKVSRVSEMRSLDKAAIETFGIPAELLMENAGQAAYFALRSQTDIQGKRFTILCGTGNNGGDGFVVARKIHANRGQVKIFTLGEPNQYRGAAKLNYDIASRLALPIQTATSIASIAEDLNASDWVIDAIFGTGLTREVQGLYREVIQAINASHKPVLSIDIPSGVHGDTGQVMGVAVMADLTVTFGLPKLGNLLYPGYHYCGKLFVSHISFPPSLYQAERLKLELNQPLPLPPRDPAGHKGTFGQLLTIAGAASYFGAPYFAALSFLKAGGGYSRLAAPQSITPTIASKGSEIVFIPQQETGSGSISMNNLDSLLELADRMDMVVLGPGLSLDPETQQLARELAARITKPVLIDGDGITAICANTPILSERPGETVLTPHLGEMARIIDKPIQQVDEHKVDLLQPTAAKLKAIIVLKGAHTLIGFPDGRVYLNLSGNSGMASAGSGDVLTGTIAAMYGLGFALPEAVRQGVFVHGMAGDLAAQAKGEDGITAQDVLDHLPHAMQALRQGLSPEWLERYRGPRVL